MYISRSKSTKDQYWYVVYRYFISANETKGQIRTDRIRKTTGKKNKKNSKVNSRNYTYDGLTFSIESAMVKDALVISNAPLYETHLFVFGTHSQRFIA